MTERDFRDNKFQYRMANLELTVAIGLSNIFNGICSRRPGQHIWSFCIYILTIQCQSSSFSFQSHRWQVTSPHYLNFYNLYNSVVVATVRLHSQATVIQVQGNSWATFDNPNRDIWTYIFTRSMPPTIVISRLEHFVYVSLAMCMWQGHTTSVRII